FFSSRRRHTRLQGDWSSDVCSSDLYAIFTCEYAKSVVKIDLVEKKVAGYLKFSKGGMPQDVRISPDGKVFYVADMKADGVFVVRSEERRVGKEGRAGRGRAACNRNV